MSVLFAAIRRALSLSTPPLSMSAENRTITVRISREYLKISSDPNAAEILKRFERSNRGGAQTAELFGVPTPDFLQALGQIIRIRPPVK
jgi:hypothetical protein